MGKKLITSLSKKRKRGEKEKGKEGKRKKEGKDGFWLTQENKQNLLGEKIIKNIKYFRDVNVFKISLQKKKSLKTVTEMLEKSF